MYAIGNLPDHVTRYNHKNQNRWMVMTAPPSRVTFWGAVEKVANVCLFGFCGAGLITAAVFILQMV